MPLGRLTESHHHTHHRQSFPWNGHPSEAGDPSETASCAACHRSQTHEHSEVQRLDACQSGAGYPSRPEKTCQVDRNIRTVDRNVLANDRYSFADDENIYPGDRVSSSGNTDTSKAKNVSNNDESGCFCSCSLSETLAQACTADERCGSFRYVCVQQNAEPVVQPTDNASPLPGVLSHCGECSCDGNSSAQERSDRQQSSSVWSSQTDQLPVRDSAAGTNICNAQTSDHSKQDSEFRVPFPRHSSKRLARTTQPADGRNWRTAGHVSRMSERSPANHTPVRRGLRRAPTRTPTPQQSRPGPFAHAATPSQSRSSCRGESTAADAAPLSGTRLGEEFAPRGCQHRTPSGRLQPPFPAARCTSSASTSQGSSSLAPPSPAASEFDCRLLKAAAAFLGQELPLSIPGTHRGQHAHRARHVSGLQVSVKEVFAKSPTVMLTQLPAGPCELPGSRSCQAPGSGSYRLLPGDSEGDDDDEVVPNSDASDIEDEDCRHVSLSAADDHGWTSSEEGSLSETSSCLSGDHGLCMCVCVCARARARACTRVCV